MISTYGNQINDICLQIEYRFCTLILWYFALFPNTICRNNCNYKNWNVKTKNILYCRSSEACKVPKYKSINSWWISICVSTSISICISGSSPWCISRCIFRSIHDIWADVYLDLLLVSTYGNHHSQCFYIWISVLYFDTLHFF